MNSFRRWWQPLLAAFLLVLVVTLWILFAPVQMGGQVSYVIVNGISMEPNYHFGDLVILRQASDYQVGDVAAYHDPTLGVFVIHRVIGTKLDHFIFKGDNNSWTDSYQPTRQELIGKLWLHVPQVGSLMQQIRNPLGMAIIAGAAGVLLMTIPVKERKKSPKKLNKKTPQNWWGSLKKSIYDIFVVKPAWSTLVEATRTRKDQAMALRNSMPDQSSSQPRAQNARVWGEVIEGLFFLLGLLALASLILGIFAFTRPVLHSVPIDINYQQAGKFSYSANGPAGVYDTGSVNSGDPVFPNLTCQVSLTFDYTIVGPGLENIAGTSQLSATVLEEISNWRRVIPLQQPTAFTGNTASVKSVINMCQVESLAAAMEQQTNFNPVFYKLDITPIIKVTGTIAGNNFQDSFTPHLVFQFDKIHAYIFNSDPASDPLNPVQAGVLKSSRAEINMLPLLGLKPEVSKMRQISLIGAGITLVGFLVLGLAIFLLSRSSQQTYLQLKYGSMLVDVQSRSLDASSPAIDVVTMDDLAKLAERNNTLILHESAGPIHTYFVQNDRTTYRYSLVEAGKQAPIISPAYLMGNIRQGIERGEFQVYYQPIVSIPDEKIVAVEALLRWMHPQHGLVNAKEFILEAERTGLIDALGTWMLKVTLAQFKEWRAAGLQIHLSVNLSARQMEKESAENIIQLIQNAGIETQSVHIEMKENNLFEPGPGLLANLQKMKNSGIELSMDNFTGQSTLTKIGRLPIHSLKIDRSLIEKIANPESAAAVGEIISSAHAQGLSVVAEGVETEEQLIFLRAALCDQAQGYLLGHPTPADELTKLLQESLHGEVEPPSA